VAHQDVFGLQGSGAVDDDPGAPSTRFARNRDVWMNFNSGWGRRAAGPEHSPELSGAGVAEHRSGSAGQDGGHPAPRLAHAPVPDGENLTVKAVERSRLHPAGDALPADPQFLELPNRDHAVLAGGDPSYGRVPLGVGEFLTHVRE
jgi:hypothetical protein